MTTAPRPETGEPRAGRIAAAGGWPLGIGFALLLVALGVQAFLKSNSEWTDVFVAAGGRLLAGEPLYPPGNAYVYPPFMAMVAAPFAHVSSTVARAAWFAASAIALVCLIRSCWLLAGLPDPRKLVRWRRRERIACVLGLVCGATYVFNTFAHQQTDVIIGALLAAGCLELARGRDLRAGLLIGVAAACKATPLVFLPYLLWRRRWMAAAASAVLALALNLAPELIGSREPEPRVAIWLSQIVLPTQQPESRLGIWFSSLIYNQSLGGTLERLANTRPDLGGGAGYREVPSLPTVAVKLLCYLSLLLLVGLSGLAAERARASPEAAARPGMPQRFAFECALLVALMLLMSPMSSPAHFAVLLLPGLCLARAAATSGSRALWALLAASALLSLVMNHDLFGGTVHSLLLWGGAVTAETLLLWAGSLLALRMTARASAGSPPVRLG